MSTRRSMSDLTSSTKALALDRRASSSSSHKHELPEDVLIACFRQLFSSTEDVLQRQRLRMRLCRVSRAFYSAIKAIPTQSFAFESRRHIKRFLASHTSMGVADEIEMRFKEEEKIEMDYEGSQEQIKDFGDLLNPSFDKIQTLHLIIERGAMPYRQTSLWARLFNEFAWPHIRKLVWRDLDNQMFEGDPCSRWLPRLKELDIGSSALVLDQGYFGSLRKLKMQGLPKCFGHLNRHSHLNFSKQFSVEGCPPLTVHLREARGSTIPVAGTVKSYHFEQLFVHELPLEPVGLIWKDYMHIETLSVDTLQIALASNCGEEKIVDNWRAFLSTVSPSESLTLLRRVVKDWRPATQREETRLANDWRLLAEAAVEACPHLQPVKTVDGSLKLIVKA